MRSATAENISVGVAATMMIGASPSRRAITFHPSPNARVTLGGNSNVLLDQGPTLQQGQAPLTYTYERDGCFVNGPFWGVASVAGTIIGITEVQDVT